MGGERGEVWKETEGGVSRNAKLAASGAWGFAQKRKASGLACKKRRRDLSYKVPAHSQEWLSRLKLG